MELKIPLYDLLNKFLTGLVFIGGSVVVYPARALSILNSEIVKNLGTGPEIVVTVAVFATAYELGLIINRFGSVIIEDVFKRLKLIPFNNDYALFNEAKKKYPIMSTLSREYALSRTGIALFLALLTLALIAGKWYISIACFVILIIYYLSCRKHAAKILELMNSVWHASTTEEGK